MSQSAPSKSSVQIDPIRQQLDELDALLQRMLNLPVSPPEPESVPPPTSSPRVSVIEELPPLPPPLPPPRAIPTPPPIYRDPVTVETPPNLPLPRTMPSRSPLPENGPPPKLRSRPLWMAPFLWIDDCFENATNPFGFLGRWLRQPIGRAFLGWVGVLCLAAAVALVLLDWFGWTRLPGLLQ
jgi:hypothetical protein